MKKIKYISFSLIALLIGILCISFIPNNKSYAQTFDYEATLVEDNAFLPDYSLIDIESFSFDNQSYLEINVVLYVNASIFHLSDFTMDSFTTNYLLLNFYDSYNELGFKSVAISCSSGNYIQWDLFYHGFFLLGNSSGCYFNIKFYSSFWDSSYSFRSNFVNVDYSDFNNIVDMTSSSFNLKLFNFKNKINNENNLIYSIVEFLLFGKFSNIYDYSFSENCKIHLVYYGDGDYFNYDKTFLFHVYFLFAKSSFDINFDTSEFLILINRPLYRLNNSLVLYNYDYYGSVLSSFSEIKFTFSRGSDYYNVLYAGDLSNSYFLVLHNNEISNIIFDNYISLRMSFGLLSSDYAYSNNVVKFMDNELIYSVNFDFNFVNYTEPLVASNGSFNYTFDKPRYVDMRFSLAPFYIPVLEMVENVFIFLMFYCPIISDILEIIHLDLFMGGIIRIINFIIGGAVGQFILSCIAFIIFFELLRRFMPVLYSAKNDIVEMYHNSNGYKYRQEKKQAKKEWKYQQYKDKQVAKQVNKLKKKNE